MNCYFSRRFGQCIGDGINAIVGNLDLPILHSRRTCCQRLELCSSVANSYCLLLLRDQIKRQCSTICQHYSKIEVNFGPMSASANVECQRRPCAGAASASADVGSDVNIVSALANIIWRRLCVGAVSASANVGHQHQSNVRPMSDLGQRRQTILLLP